MEHISDIFSIFLRNPDIWVFSQKEKVLLEELRTEAKFYGLEDPMFKKHNRAPRKQQWLDGKVKIESFSSQYVHAPATNILDPVKCYWLSDKGKIENEWIVFEFDKETFVSKLSLKVDNFECTVKDWVLQVSNNDDKTNWKDIKSYEAKCGKQCKTEQIYEDLEIRTKYIRLFFKNNWGPGGGDYILVGKVRFYGAELDSF